MTGLIARTSCGFRMAQAATFSSPTTGVRTARELRAEAEGRTARAGPRLAETFWNAIADAILTENPGLAEVAGLSRSNTDVKQL